MKKETDFRSTGEIFSAPTPNMVAMTAAINQSMATSDVNAYSVRNTAVIASKKRSILYRNGHTLPASAERLLAEAQSNIQHSRKLGQICSGRSRIQRAQREPMRTTWLPVRQRGPTLRGC